MRTLIMCAIALICNAATLKAQVSYTANDTVPSYNGNFYYGVNGGWAWTWDSKTIADIAAGNPIKNIEGIHSRSFRTLLRSSDIAWYGYHYDMFVPEYEYYKDLGMRDYTAMIESPAPAERDSIFFDDNNQIVTTNACGQASYMFKNMYTPIWDGGLNGTPYNDTNYYAKFVYETAIVYKDYVKFWEVVNEPDFDISQQAWMPRGMAGNWWENVPRPCSLRNLWAPIYYYIRMLRIAYEVIKTVDPTAYVGPGGLGYTSFADNLCRFTDNPADGSVTPDYPLPATAYMDMLSFHSYPQYAMGAWSNAANGFVYERNSDRGALEFVKLRYEFDSILAHYGYDGVQYPKKVFICTETNIPSKAFGVYLGSHEAQTNYLIKVLVESQKHEVRQTYPFVMGDGQTVANATDGFELMGLYECLTDNGPISGGTGYNQVMKNSGIGFKTTSTLLLNAGYNAAKTAAMNLPANIGGAAFQDSIGGYTYVLWAKATLDNSEAATANYTFPASMNPAPELEKRLWNWSRTALTETIQSTNVALTGTPIFLSEHFTILPVKDKPAVQPVDVNNDFFVNIYPNPANTTASIAFNLKSTTKVNISIFNAEGQLMATPVINQSYTGGNHVVALPVQKLVSGVYYCRFETEKSKQMKKLVIAK